MLFYNLFRALLPAKHRPHRDNRPIQYLVQTIHSHTIDSLQKPTETLPQFIDNYLSPVNVNKRDKASKRLREIVQQTSADKNEHGILDCVEAFRQSVDNFIRAYTSGNEALVIEEYEKFQGHFRLLFCRLRFCFLLPAWNNLNLDALNTFELFGGVYLLLDILLLDYYLNIQRFGNVSFKPEVVLAVRKYIFYFLFDAFYTRWHYRSGYILSVQQLYCTNPQLITIFLGMLNTQPAYRFTYLYINQSIIWLYQHIINSIYRHENTIPFAIDLPELFHINMRRTNVVNILKRFCNRIQDKEMFVQSLNLLGELTLDHYHPELYHNFNRSMNFVLRALRVPFELEPENNRIRILFRRFCEKVLSRRIFCAAKNAYGNLTHKMWDFFMSKISSQIISSILFNMNSDSKWRNWIGRMIYSTLEYFFFESRLRSDKLYSAVSVLNNILYDIDRHPDVLERIRQEDICATLVDILSIERTDFMVASCESIKLLVDIEHRGEEAEPELERLKELAVVEKLEHLMKYSAEGEEIHDLAKEILDNLTN